MTETTPEPSTPKRSYRRTESWGSTRKLKSGRYQASYSAPDGNRYNAPHTFTALKDARAWLSEVRVSIENGTWKPPHEQRSELFGEYTKTWLRTRLTSKGEPLRPKTLQGYNRIVENAFPTLDPLPIARITPAFVRDWHAKRQLKGATQAAREASLLRAILNTAVTDGIIDRNPVDDRMTRGRTGQKHRPPTLDELAQLVDRMPDEWRAAVLIAAYGGLRLSEWRALRRRDVEFVPVLGDDGKPERDENGKRTHAGYYLVHVTRQAQRITGQGWVVGPPKSDEGVRIVPLSSHLTPAIRHHLEAHTGRFASSLLFEPRGESEFVDDQRFNQPWTAAREALGLDGVVREHDLRAFAGTVFAQSGATIREVQAHLGHSSMAAAAVYQTTTGRGPELADLMPALPVPKRSNITRLPTAKGN